MTGPSHPSVASTRDASAALVACPQCDSPAYFCDKSDHGTVNGPAIHCRRSPAHNAFDPSEFPRWRFHV